jgi:signal transduction histidine kinase
MSVLTALAIIAASSLVILTSYLRDDATDLRAAVESVRLVEEAQVDLLLHSRAADPLVRVDVERRLRRRLVEASGYVTTTYERDVHAKAEQQLEVYLAAGARAGSAQAPSGLTKDGDAPLEQAFRALEELIDVNVTQAREIEAQAARWAHVGNALGTTVAGLLIAGVAATILWIRAIAFRPIFATAHAMRRFGSGEKSARAEEAGPAELQEIAKRFNEMATSLSQQHERQMAFLAGVAHDLRTPLSALKLSAAIVQPDGPLPPEARVRSTMALVRRQVERLERMVGDFLDVARIEAGQLDLKLERFDVCELIRGVIELFQSTSTAHSLRLDAPGDPVMLLGDPSRIEQVLNNLVSNAIKYSPAGGEIALRVSHAADQAVISVSDRGLGVAPEEQARLFEPFRRLSSSALTIPGIGLGLFVSRRIAEAHGGSIEIQSVLQEGSTFTLRLPLEPPPRAHVNAQPPRRGAEQGPA